jgi:Tfp pilus assembly protein PilN
MALEIEGKALDTTAISNYMINLDKSPYINNVDLKTVKTDTSSGGKASQGIIVKSFVITCNITFIPEKTG